MKKEQNKLFLILCNHRTGSSATAGVLYHLGINMGDKLLGAGPFNPKGHFENKFFIQMNDNILKSVHANWRNPPSRSTISSSDFSKDQIISFIKNQSKPIWGLKDPRTALTFDLWKPHLEGWNEITYIFVWRTIEESILSLSTREQIDIKTAEAILTPYDINLKEFRKELQQEGNDILDIHYENLLENPTEFVSEINSRLNNRLDQNLAQVNKFLDSRLKHN
jgi:hypothetical protein